MRVSDDTIVILISRLLIARRPLESRHPIPTSTISRGIRYGREHAI